MRYGVFSPNGRDGVCQLATDSLQKVHPSGCITLEFCGSASVAQAITHLSTAGTAPGRHTYGWLSWQLCPCFFNRDIAAHEFQLKSGDICHKRQKVLRVSLLSIAAAAITHNNTFRPLFMASITLLFSAYNTIISYY